MRGVCSRLGISLALAACAALLSAASAAAVGCPNELGRVGPSAGLPECRAYEMVSPPDKGDGFVQRLYPAQSAPGGDGIAFLTTSAFGQAEASPVYNVYLSERDGAVGWSTASVEPQWVNGHGLLEVASTAVSEDLGETLQASFVALAPGAIEGGSNVYVRDNRTGVRTLIASEPGPELLYNFAGSRAIPYVGGSPDWDHLILSSATPMAEGVPSGTPEIYDYTAGHMEVVSRLENGEVAPTGAFRGGGGERNGVSGDGSRVYFEVGSGSSAPLYMREDDRRTIPVSVSQKPGPEEGELKGVDFAGASADDSIAYFTSAAELTDASHTHGVPTLYRFELGSERVTDLTPSSESAAEGAAVLKTYGVSDDGSFIYFAARAALAPGAAAAAAGDTNLYAWHDGTIKLIAFVPGEENGPTFGMASPDGLHFAFASSEPLTTADVPSPNCPAANPVPEHCTQVYEYEYATGELDCITCAGPARGDSTLGQLDFGDDPFIGNHSGRAVLDNGSVLVDTPNPLVSKDSNGIEDVYLWRGGTSSLISTGTSDQPSVFADATPDGSDIYFRSDQRLVGIDVDSATDLYDARVDGGLAVQNPPGSPPPCEGEACRGASPASPSLPPLSSARHGSCTQLSREARRATKAAKRAGHRAAAASRPGAVGRLRRVASRRQAKARRVHREADLCRRAGR